MAITRHDKPRAVMVSIEDFEAILATRSNALQELKADYEQMLQDMQKPEQRAGMQKAFHASPAELGAAALKAAQDAL